MQKVTGMPELPDVEHAKKYISENAVGGKITAVKVLRRTEYKKRNPSEQELSILKNKKIEGADRRGKFLILNIDGKDLIFHFRMTGWLNVVSDDVPISDNTRMIFSLDDDREMRFDDRRNIGEIYLTDRGKWDEAGTGLLAKIGVDPLSGEFTFDYFKKLTEKNKRTEIKKVLMNQKSIAGIGNLYSDEILFKARIRPQRKSGSTDDEELRTLYKSVRQVLRKAVAVDADVNKIPNSLLANRKDGFCPVSGNKFKKTKIGGRTSTFCEVCQA